MMEDFEVVRLSGGRKKTGVDSNSVETSHQGEKDNDNRCSLFQDNFKSIVLAVVYILVVFLLTTLWVTFLVDRRMETISNDIQKGFLNMVSLKAEEQVQCSCSQLYGELSESNPNSVDDRHRQNVESQDFVYAASPRPRYPPSAHGFSSSFSDDPQHLSNDISSEIKKPPENHTTPFEELTFHWSSVFQNVSIKIQHWMLFHSTRTEDEAQPSVPLLVLAVMGWATRVIFAFVQCAHCTMTQFKNVSENISVRFAITLGIILGAVGFMVLLRFFGLSTNKKATIVSSSGRRRLSSYKSRQRCNRAPNKKGNNDGYQSDEEDWEWQPPVRWSTLPQKRKTGRERTPLQPLNKFSNLSKKERLAVARAKAREASDRGELGTIRQRGSA